MPDHTRTTLFACAAFVRVWQAGDLNGRIIQAYVYHVQVSSVRVSSVSLNSARRGAGVEQGQAFGLLFHNPPNQKLSKVRISKLDISPKNDKTRA